MKSKTYSLTNFFCRALLTGALAISVIYFSGCNNPEVSKYCPDSTPVSLINDNTVPASVKNKILYQPRKLVSTYVPGDISKINPKFPSGKIVVINVATADYPPNMALSKQDIRDVIFDTTPGKPSIANYYSENSYGQFSVSEGQITDWVVLTTKVEDYKNSNGQHYGAEGNVDFMKDILSAASINWGSLDTNANGVIESEEAQVIVLVPLSDPNAKSIDTLRPKGWASTRDVPNIGSISTPSGSFNFENRKVVYISVKASFIPGAAVDPFESKKVLAHELGHAFFNLTDRYGAGRTIGDYEIMSASNSNSWLHMNVHDKMKIGWVTPTFLAQGYAGRARFVPIETNRLSALVLLKPDGEGGLDTKEYWIVEFKRRDTGHYDADLPEEAGLAIYYVRESAYYDGFDEIILVDYKRPDQTPQQYHYDGYFYDALFKEDSSNPVRKLYDQLGVPVRTVSDVYIGGDFACVKFW